MSTSLPSLQCRVGEKRGWGVDGDEGRARKEGVYRQVMEGGSAGTVVMWEGEWVRAEGHGGSRSDQAFCAGQG